MKTRGQKGHFVNIHVYCPSLGVLSLGKLSNWLKIVLSTGKSLQCKELNICRELSILLNANGNDIQEVINKRLVFLYKSACQITFRSVFE